MPVHDFASHQDTELLTEREREVLALARLGLSNNEIANQLGLTRNAVRFHMKSLHSKLETRGERRRLTMRLRGLGFLGLFGSSAAMNAAQAAAVVALSIDGFLAVRAAYNTAPDAEAAPQVIAVTAWDGATVGDFAMIYQTREATILGLNPGLASGPIVAGQEILVPVPPNMTLAEAKPTPH